MSITGAYTPGYGHTAPLGQGKKADNHIILLLLLRNKKESVV